MNAAADGVTGQHSGERVADLAAHLLRRAADISDGVAQNNAALAEDFRRNAETYRLIADKVAEDPRGDPVRSGVHVRLEGLVDPRSDRRWSHGEIGVRMLRDAASLVDNIAGQDNEALRDVAAVFRQCAMYLSSAPDAVMNEELDRLTPYLEAGERVQQGLPPRRVDSALIKHLLTTSGFRDIAARTYELRVGRNFDTLFDQAQQAWAGNIAATWIDRHGPPSLPLDAEQQEAIAFAAAHPRGPWRLPPLVPGDWTDLAAQDAAAVLRLVGGATRLGDGQIPIVLHHYCDRVRTRTLACHGGLLLVEMQGYASGGDPGLISAIVLDDGVFLADGTSAPLHNLNHRLGAQLDTPEARHDYALLFLNWVRGDDGRFQPLETPRDIDHRLAEPLWATDHLTAYAAPLAEAEPRPEYGWRLKGPVVYGAVVFSAEFELSPNGAMEMVDDQVLLTNIPLRAEVLDGSLVRLDAPIPPMEVTDDPDALDQ